MKKFTSCIRSKANGLALRARMALSNQRGDFYISDAVKIIIAVVLGALLLAALTLIFNDPPDHAGDRGPVRRSQLRACSLKCRQRGSACGHPQLVPAFLFSQKTTIGGRG